MDSTSMSQIPGRLPPVRPPVATRSRRSPEAVPLLYAGLRALARPLLNRFFDFRVAGLEHVPTEGPLIVAANHANYLDGVVLGAALSRKIVFLVAPHVYYATRLHTYLHRHIGSIPINLSRPDAGAIRRMLRILGRGGVVGIFPEGPPNRNGDLMPGQPGVALVALRLGVPVTPAAITGTFAALTGRLWHIPRRVPLRIRFGQPLRFVQPPHGPLTHTLRADVTVRIMAEIAALLDEDRRLSAAGGALR